MVGERAQRRRGEPSDADRGAERDAGGEPEPVRQVLLAHHDGDAEVRDHDEADRDEQDRRGPAADEQERDEQRRERAHRQHDDQAPPQAVDEPAADVGPHRARDQHHAQRAVAGRLARPQLDGEVDRDERLQPEEDRGAQADDGRQPGERPPFVVAQRRLAAVHPRHRGGRVLAQPAELARRAAPRRATAGSAPAACPAARTRARRASRAAARARSPRCRRARRSSSPARARRGWRSWPSARPRDGRPRRRGRSRPPPRRSPRSCRPARPPRAPRPRSRARAASATAARSRSEATPNSGCTIEEPRLAASSSAPAAP